MRQYDTFDINLHIVEDLIDYFRVNKRHDFIYPEVIKVNKRHDFICDFAVECCPYEGLIDALAKRIREHYGKIGDNNFIVNFG